MKNTNQGLEIIAILLSFGLIACTTPFELLQPGSVNPVGSQEFSEIKEEAPQETDNGEWVTWTYEDGSRYEGEARKYGKGTLTWPDGERYEGEWQNDMRHGRGIYIWPDGVSYKGEWRSDKMHGKGTLTWPDGRHYEGEWQDDMRHGKGTLAWPDGERYEGE